jgi:hypothetical protein
MEERLDLVSILYKHLTDTQRNFVDVYVRCKGDVKKCVKELGCGVPNFKRLYEVELVQDYLKALKADVGTSVITVTPTLEWIQTQLMDLYKTAVEEEDADGAQRLLKDITGFRVKFGKQLDEDSVRISRMLNPELVGYITSEFNALKADLKEKMWYEKSREAFKYEAKDDKE